MALKDIRLFGLSIPGFANLWCFFVFALLRPSRDDSTVLEGKYQLGH